jgi:hypothetical protein
LGGTQPKGTRIPDDGLHSTHGQEALSQLRMIPDGLLRLR